MKENVILEKFYQDAGKLNIKTIPNDIQKDIDVMIKKMEYNKSLISAIITSLIKRFLHQNKMYVSIGLILLTVILQECWIQK